MNILLPASCVCSKRSTTLLKTARSCSCARACFRYGGSSSSEDEAGEEEVGVDEGEAVAVAAPVEEGGLDVKEAEEAVTKTLALKVEGTLGLMSFHDLGPIAGVPTGLAPVTPAAPAAAAAAAAALPLWCPATTATPPDADADADADAPGTEAAVAPPPEGET